MESFGLHLPNSTLLVLSILEWAKHDSVVTGTEVVKLAAGSIVFTEHQYQGTEDDGEPLMNYR